jgi:hypothetical protein
MPWIRAPSNHNVHLQNKNLVYSKVVLKQDSRCASGTSTRSTCPCTRYSWQCQGTGSCCSTPTTSTSTSPETSAGAPAAPTTAPCYLARGKECGCSGSPRQARHHWVGRHTNGSQTRGVHVRRCARVFSQPGLCPLKQVLHEPHLIGRKEGHQNCLRDLTRPRGTQHAPSPLTQALTRRHNVFP